MIAICHYDGSDHSLIISAAPPEDNATPRCTLEAYTDTDGWRCFTDHHGEVVRMRFDLALPTTDCTLVGRLLGPAVQGLAREVLDEIRGQPGVSRTRSHQA
ncbi:MAG: hypothetical protein WCC60_04960 [Ilumatobacteraceae bacterium]